MKWVYRGMMAVSMIGGALVTGGVLPMAFAAVFTATGTAAALFHEAPKTT